MGHELCEKAPIVRGNKTDCATKHYGGRIPNVESKPPHSPILIPRKESHSSQDSIKSKRTYGAQRVTRSLIRGWFVLIFYRQPHPFHFSSTLPFESSTAVSLFCSRPPSTNPLHEDAIATKERKKQERSLDTIIRY